MSKEFAGGVMTIATDHDTGHRRASATSVLRWMGSKKRSASAIASRLPLLGAGSTYFEPFFGGGSVFFAYGPHRSALGDSNQSLMNAWRWIKTDAHAVWRGVASLDATKSSFYLVRALRYEPGTLDDAVRFIYLNRYCFNGIYRTNRRNEFNVPFGRNTGALPQKDAFETCGNALANAAILTGDFTDSLATATAGDIVYLDPPWQTDRATYGEYGYTPHLDVTSERVLQVAVDLSARGATTFVSLPKSVAPTFADWPMIDLEVNYRVASNHASRSKQTELLVKLPPASTRDVTL